MAVFAAALALLQSDAVPAARAQASGKVWLLTGLAFHGTCAERSMSLPPKTAASFGCTFSGAPGQVEGNARLAVQVPLRIDPEQPIDIRFAANATVRLIGYPPDRGASLRVETRAPLSPSRWPYQSVFKNDVGSGTAALMIDETGSDPEYPPRAPLDSETRPLKIYFDLTAGPTAGVGGPAGGIQFFEVEATYTKSPPPPPDLRVIDAKLFQVSEAATAIVAGRLFGLRAVIESTGATDRFGVSATFRQQGQDTLRVTDFYPLDPASMTPAGRLVLSDTLRFNGPGTQVVYFTSRDPRSPLLLDPKAGSGEVSATVDVDIGNRIAEDVEGNNQRQTRSPVVAKGWGAHDDPNLAVVVFDRGGPPTWRPTVPASWLRHRLQRLFPVMNEGVQVRVSAESARDSELDIPPTADAFLKLLQKLLKPKASLDGRLVFTVPTGWFAQHAPAALRPRKAFSLPQSQWGVYGRIILIEGGWRTAASELAIVREVAHTFGVPLTESRVGAVPDGMSLPQGTTYPWDEITDSVEARRDGLRNAEGRIHVVKSIMSSDAILPMLTGIPFQSWITGADYNTLLASETLPVPTPSLSSGAGRTHRTAPLAAASTTVAPSPILLVSGTLRRDGTAALDPAWRLSDGQADPARPGDYAFALFDAAGREVVRQSFPVRWSLGDEADAPALDAWPLLASVPWQAGTVRVALQRGSTTLAELRASANAPTVRLDTPNGGSMGAGPQGVRWTASDPDGDALHYAVAVSGDDGQTWTMLAIDLTGTSYAWDTDTAPGGAAVRIKVIATDGLHTAEDTSDGALTIANKAPVAWIDTPPDGATFARGEAVPLSGGGDDLEDGPLSDAGLAWRSDRDGPLGAGSSVTTNGLSVGTHVLTLSAADSVGHRIEVARTVTIVRDAAPDVLLTADNIGIAPDPVAERDRAMLAAIVHARNRAAACTVFVYDGDPRAGSRLVGTADVAVGANAEAGVLIPWTPLGVGRHAIHVLVSSCVPREADTGNNWAVRDIDVGPSRLRTVFLPAVLRAHDDALPFQPRTPTATPPTPPTPGGQPGPTLTPSVTPTAAGSTTPAASATSRASATPGTSVTPATTPSASATNDPLGTAVAATLTALAPTPTASPTPNLIATSVAATLTALAATPTPSATPDVFATAIAATLTALAPSPTVPPSATPTPSASPAAATVTLDAVRTTGADPTLMRTAFAPGEPIGLWMKLTNTGAAARRVPIQYEVIGEGGFAPPELSWSETVDAPPGESWQHIDRTVPSGTPWGPYAFLATLQGEGDPIVLDAAIVVGTRLLAADDFSSPASGWGSGETTGIRYGYMDGAFRLLITLSDYFARTAGPLTANDVLAEADVARLGTARGAAGLLFGLTPAGNTFAMFAARSDGRFGVYARDNGTWRAVHEWTAAPSLHTDQTPNHLMLAQHGTELRLYANGRELAVLPDSGAPFGGRLGLYAEAIDPGLDARFDNWRAYALPARP